MNILMLADYHHECAAVIDHIRGIIKTSKHNYTIINPIRNQYPLRSIECFDAILIHYSIYIIHGIFLSRRYKRLIAEFEGYKIQFAQDEYREVSKLAEEMANLGIDALFTLYARDQMDKVYDQPHLKNLIKIKTLTGYVPSTLSQIKSLPISCRERHVGYRGRSLPFWLGKLAQEKKLISEGVKSRAQQFKLDIDVSHEENQRIYGKSWIEFLATSRATLITESGASITDKDGHIEREVAEYLKDNEGASFEEVEQKILGPYEGNIHLNTMSPRIFEAAALRTPMVAFPGFYEGVIRPGKHYIPLEKDFSNFEEVAALLKDDEYLQCLADKTHEDLIQSGLYSYDRLATAVDGIIDEHGNPTLAIESRESDFLPPDLRIPAAQKSRSRKILAVKIFAFFWYILWRCLWWFPFLEVKSIGRAIRSKRTFSERAGYIGKKAGKYLKPGIYSHTGLSLSILIPCSLGLLALMLGYSKIGIFWIILYAVFVAMVALYDSSEEKHD